MLHLNKGPESRTHYWWNREEKIAQHLAGYEPMIFPSWGVRFIAVLQPLPFFIWIRCCCVWADLKTSKSLSEPQKHFCKNFRKKNFFRQNFFPFHASTSSYFLKPDVTSVLEVLFPTFFCWNNFFYENKKFYWIKITRVVVVQSSFEENAGFEGCVAQRKHSCFPPSSPRFESRLCRDFLSSLLSVWTVLRSKPSSAMQRISQMQLAVTFRANHYKKARFEPWVRVLHLCDLSIAQIVLHWMRQMA